jgi:hypothetical protein
MWKDTRLNHEGRNLKQDLVVSVYARVRVHTRQVGVDYKNKLWVPDTFFPNEKNSFFHLATTHNSFLRISAAGDVSTSQR